jgi:uncharacterized protein YgiM (DUF1202 family)
MKKKYGVILAAMLATGAIAQTATNSAPPPLPEPTGAAAPAAAPAPPPPMPAESAATNAPATKKSVKKKKAKRPAIVEPAGAPFLKDETAMARQNNVNVRAQSHINSEVVFHLQKGDSVTVMNEVTLTHPKADEPSRWVQIMLPPSTPVWVSGKYLDANSAVTSKKLNVRSGPGENYSVVGELQKGDTVKNIHEKEGWVQIEAPTNAFGFVAAHLLAHKETPPPPVDLTMGNQPAPVMTPVNGGSGMTVTPASGAPGSTVPPAGSGSETAPAVPAPAAEAGGVPTERVVSREGSVGDTVSIQAPTYFQLESLDDGKVIDYLYTTSPNLVLEHWRGKKVLVQGVESLDERWPSTPVLTIQKIQIVVR